MAYSIYIVSNVAKTTLYIGITNDLPSRILEHGLNAGNMNTFAGKYRCYHLLYYEEYKYVSDAINREKQLKRWSRKKKETLIKNQNPDFNFLNKALGLYPYGDYVDKRNIENRRSNT